MKLPLDDFIEILRKLSVLSLCEQDPSAKTLSTNFFLKTLPFFRTLDPKKDQYQLEPQTLIEKFKVLESSINQLIRGLSQAKKLIKNIDISSESQFLDFFRDKLTKNTINTIFLHELWRFIRNFSLKPRDFSTINFPLIFELIKLGFLGFSIPSDDYHDFPLHSSLFTHELSRFEELLSANPSLIDSLDPKGNSPYKLALFLHKFDFAKLILSCNSDSKLRYFPLASSGFEDTIILKEKPLLREIFLALQRKKLERWEKSRFLLSEKLKQIPDFDAQMNWECDSKFLPFLCQIAPKDTCKIQKKGDKLTISLSVLGFGNFSVKNGDFLAVFANSQVFLIDKAQGKIQQLNQDFTDEIFLENLIKKTLENPQNFYQETDLKTEKMRFEVLKNIKGKPIVEKIENFEAFKYEIKGEMVMKKRLGNPKFSFIEKNLGFEDYFEKAVKDAVFLYRNNEYFNMDYSVISHLCEVYKKLEKENLRGNSACFQQRSKNINATLWMIKDFPLNFQHIIPILEILEIFSSNIRKFKDFLKTFGYKSYFPIKVSIPLFFSIYASITFSKFRFETAIIREISLKSQNFEQSFAESDQSLEIAHQKFNSLIKTRNKASTNSDYLNIFEEKNAIFEENLQEEEEILAQIPRILHKNLKTMVSKNNCFIIEEISPELRGIIKNAMDLNRNFIKKFNGNNKETVIWGEDKEKESSLDKSFQELEMIVKGKGKGKGGKEKKLRDVDVKLKR